MFWQLNTESKKKIKSIIICLGLQFTICMAVGCEKDVDRSSKKEKLGGFMRSLISITNPLSKIHSHHASENQHKQSLTTLPPEINLHITSFVFSLVSVVSLKFSCKYFDKLIDDGLLYAKIPVEVISFFPKETPPIDIVLGSLIYNKGLKNNNKKLIKKAAILRHKDAIDWFSKREQSKIAFKKEKANKPVVGYAGFGGGIVSSTYH